MSNQKTNHIIINSISELHALMSLPKPEHPLVSLIKLEEGASNRNKEPVSVTLNLYSISLKKLVNGKLKYGRNYYDFDEGTMAMMSPGQILTSEGNEDYEAKGWWLVFHPDFIRNYQLAKRINNFGFFSYAVNEALHLSAKEEKMIKNVMLNISGEYQTSIDHYSQDVMISQIELLLNYVNRFYNRQFITRKIATNDVLTKAEALLASYFQGDQVKENGLPTAQYVADNLHLSVNYLSDMLKSLTGQSLQQHIHNHLIERAKEILTSTSLSINEVAYELGFDYPQYFNRLFKNKTGVTPLQFRHSFN